MRRPNIVFYFSDQQRFDTLGCCGQSLDVTPNLDTIAGEGVVFDNFYSCQPVCGPARACLQDGRYPSQTGCFTNGIALDFSRKHIADYFNEAGYDTAYVGKWHLASDSENGIDYRTDAVPMERRAGYKHWMASDVLEFTSHGYNGYVFDGDCRRHDFIGYRADAINSFAVDYIHSCSADDPFFLFISQIEPHHQNDHGHYEGPDGSKSRFMDFHRPADLLPGAGDWEEEFPDYLGCCNRLDYNVGLIVDALKEKGLWDNTIFIYTSDHGSHFRTRNLEYKRSCHDASVHIPLVMTGPGISKGRRVAEMTSLIDIPATLLDFASIEIPDYFQGRSLKALAGGKHEDGRDDVFIQISESQIGRAIRTKDYKYSARASGDPWHECGSSVYYEDSLYDLEKDPGELENLVGDPGYEPVRKILRDILKRRISEIEGIQAEILPSCDKPHEIMDDYNYDHI